MTVNRPRIDKLIDHYMDKRKIKIEQIEMQANGTLNAENARLMNH